MPNLASLQQSSKDANGVQRQRADSISPSHATKTSTWRLRRPKSISSAHKSYRSGELLEGPPTPPPPIPTRQDAHKHQHPDIMTAVGPHAINHGMIGPPNGLCSTSAPSSPLSSPNLSPLSFSTAQFTDSKSTLRSPASPFQSERGSRTSGEDILKPPQPAFLGGRSGRSSISINPVVISDFNSSTASLESGPSMRNVNIPNDGHEAQSGDSRYTASSANAPYRSEVSSTASGSIRSTIRSLGKKLFSKRVETSTAKARSNVSEKHERTQSDRQAQTDPRASRRMLDPSSADKPYASGFHLSTESHEADASRTPSMLSSQSTSYSSSSCTSSVSTSPSTPNYRRASQQSFAKSISVRKPRPNVGDDTATEHMSSTVPPSPLSGIPITLGVSPTGSDKTGGTLVADEEYHTAKEETFEALQYLERSSLNSHRDSMKVITQSEWRGLWQHEDKRRKSAGQENSDHVRQSSHSGDSDSEDDYDVEPKEANDLLAVSPMLRAISVKKTHNYSARQPGLDSPAKRALYTLTLMKFHPQLAAKVSSPAANLRSSPFEVRLPRSVNPAKVLQAHPSTNSHTRCFRIGLARSNVVRRLKMHKLSSKHEEELSWFTATYLPHYIAPEQVASHLAQRAAETSLEALARPPLHQGKDNGMSRWANRPSFSTRCQSTLADPIADDVMRQDVTLHVGQVLKRAPSAARAMPLQISDRCQVLAGVQGAVAESDADATISSLPFPNAFPKVSPNKQYLAVREGTPKRPAPWAKPSVTSTVDAKRSRLAQKDAERSRLSVPRGSDVASKSRHEKNIEGLKDEDDDVPLARLVHRHSQVNPSLRSLSDCGTPSSADLFRRQVQEQREQELRRRKETEKKLLDDQKRLIAQARERRQQSQRSRIISSPSYDGAGGSKSSHVRSKAASTCGDPAMRVRDSTGKRPHPHTHRSTPSVARSATNTSPAKGKQIEGTPRVPPLPATPMMSASASNVLQPKIRNMSSKTEGPQWKSHQTRDARSHSSRQSLHQQQSLQMAALAHHAAEYQASLHRLSGMILGMPPPAVSPSTMNVYNRQSLSGMPSAYPPPLMHFNPHLAPSMPPSPDHRLALPVTPTPRTSRKSK